MTVKELPVSEKETPPLRAERISKYELQGTKTLGNLKTAFAGEAQANRRYLYFAKKAEEEGLEELAKIFASTAAAETGHAFGHLEILKLVGDPVTGERISSTQLNLQSGVAGETYEYTTMYPEFARVAEEEGFPEIAKWFESLAKVEKLHAERFADALKRTGRT